MFPDQFEASMGLTCRANHKVLLDNPASTRLCIHRPSVVETGVPNPQFSATQKLGTAQTAGSCWLFSSTARRCAQNYWRVMVASTIAGSTQNCGAVLQADVWATSFGPAFCSILAALCIQTAWALHACTLLYMSEHPRFGPRLIYKTKKECIGRLSADPVSTL